VQHPTGTQSLNIDHYLGYIKVEELLLSLILVVKITIKSDVRWQNIACRVH